MVGAKMENGWTERIEELEESRNNWKREWSLLNAALNMAEDRIKELEAERDADRRREYGYSQQTVDALTLERDKLRAERNDWKSRYQSVSEMHDALIAEFNEMRAENKRLQEFYLFESVETAREQITGTGIIETVAIEE
jgi:uncharacterized coiled-coil DUF342 family protein